MSDKKKIPMLDIYQQEAQGYVETLEKGILEIEANQSTDLEILMRSAHSIKGAARIIGIHTIGDIAHILEDIFVFLQKTPEVTLTSQNTNILLQATDYLKTSSHVPEETALQWLESVQPSIDGLLPHLKKILTQITSPHSSDANETLLPPVNIPSLPEATSENFVRLSATEMEQLTSISAHALLEGQQLQTYVTKLKTQHAHTPVIDHMEQLVNEHTYLMEKLHYRLLKSKLTPFSSLSKPLPSAHQGSCSRAWQKC